MIDFKKISEQNSFLGKTLDERMKYYKNPSISIALIEENQIMTFCRGYKDRDAKLEVDVDTIYQAGSISKPFFAVAVMKLVAKGILELDSDIQEYGNYEFYETYDGKRHKVTLRQLLSHTAGFNLHGFAGYKTTQKIPDIMQILKGEEPSDNIPLFMFCEPGTRWSYSGGGYMLAQKVVTDVLKKDITDVINDEILKPFGLSHSTYRNPSGSNENNFACGYNFYNQCIEGNYHIMPETAAAGLWTTPTDIVRFGKELMKACDGTSNVFEYTSMMEMLKQPIPDAQTGLGLFVPNLMNEKYYFDHTGSNGGYHCIMCFQAATGTGYVAMLNSDIGRGLLGEIDSVLCENLEM